MFYFEYENIRKKYSDILHEELSDTLRSVKNPNELLKKLNELDSQPERLLNRLRSWMSFINLKFPISHSYYTKLIYIVIDAVTSNDIFVQQTPFEFETSKLFFEQFWSLTCKTPLERVNPKSLFSLALIYGKYPGMVRCKFSDAVQCYYKLSYNSSHEYKDPAIQFFITMFERYPSPPIFLYNFSNLSSDEIDCLIFITYGQNIRNFDKRPYPISRKESFLINQFSLDIDFENQTLKKTIVCAKLKNDITCSDLLLENFISVCKDFSVSIDAFYTNIEFWKSALHFIGKYVDFQDTNELFTFVDYFMYMNNKLDGKYNLKGRTFKSVKREIDYWHTNTTLDDLDIDMETIWAVKGIETTYYNDNTIRIREINTVKNLLKESKEMKHCVFSYLNFCISGYSSIWQMQKKVENKYKSIVTIEVCDKYIIQATGYCNRPLESEEQNILSLWANDVGFTINHKKSGLILNN
jgi:hypothetical protein